MKRKYINFMLALICGFIIANMYFIQSLTPLAMKELNRSFLNISHIYTLSLIGNIFGLLLVVPLGDYLNRKRMILIFCLLLSISSLFFYLSDDLHVIYTSSFFIGFSICCIPIIISYLSKNKCFSVDIVGILMSGALIGIMLSRFISGLVGSFFSWNTIYFISSIIILTFTLFLFFIIPNDKKPEKKLNYIYVIKNNIKFLFNDKRIRSYCYSGFIVMVIFSSFWNNVSSYLFNIHHLTIFEISLFSLTGFGGAIAAILSKKIFKNTGAGSFYFFIVIIISFSLLFFDRYAFLTLVIVSFIMDSAVQLIHINNQLNIYTKCNGDESKAASCYMFCFILGGIIGSKISSSVYMCWGWHGIMIMIMIIIMIVIVILSCTCIPMYYKKNEHR